MGNDWSSFIVGKGFEVCCRVESNEEVSEEEVVVMTVWSMLTYNL